MVGETTKKNNFKSIPKRKLNKLKLFKEEEKKNKKK